MHRPQVTQHESPLSSPHVSTSPSPSPTRISVCFVQLLLTSPSSIGQWQSALCVGNPSGSSREPGPSTREREVHKQSAALVLPGWRVVEPPPSLGHAVQGSGLTSAEYWPTLHCVHLGTASWPAPSTPSTSPVDTVYLMVYKSLGNETCSSYYNEQISRAALGLGAVLVQKGGEGTCRAEGKT